MTSDELELWNKIKSFQFDKQNIKLTFAKRLAKENGISEQFADQIVDEYRKFIFLCCVSKGQIAPSHLVDQAWHLHLTYTRSYWVDLCTNTINRDLHHNPTEGGREEDAKFKNLYEDTLALYESYFSSTAPKTVWPDKNEKPKNTDIKIEKSKNWIIPKPNFNILTPKSSLSIVAVIFLSLLLGCSVDAVSIPIVLVFLAIIAIVVFVIRKSNRQTNDSGCSSGFSSGCGGDSHSHSHGGDGGHAGDSGHSGDSGDSGGGDSGCSSSGCSGGCGGGGD